MHEHLKYYTGFANDLWGRKCIRHICKHSESHIMYTKSLFVHKTSPHGTLLITFCPVVVNVLVCMIKHVATLVTFFIFISGAKSPSQRSSAENLEVSPSPDKNPTEDSSPHPVCWKHLRCEVFSWSIMHCNPPEVPHSDSWMNSPFAQTY